MFLSQTFGLGYISARLVIFVFIYLYIWRPYVGFKAWILNLESQELSFYTDWRKQGLVVVFLHHKFINVSPTAWKGSFVFPLPHSRRAVVSLHVGFLIFNFDFSLSNITIYGHYGHRSWPI